METVNDWITSLAPDDPLCDGQALPIPQGMISVLFADSEESGTPPTFAIDGDPQTFWHTEWQASDPVHPHEIQLDVVTTYALAGITYLPRQTASPLR